MLQSPIYYRWLTDSVKGVATCVLDGSVVWAGINGVAAGTLWPARIIHVMELGGEVHCRELA